MDDITKVKENKSWQVNGIPRFSLALKEKTSEEQKRRLNYDVLSKLVGNNDVVIELIGSFLDLPPKKRASYILEFLETVRAMGVEYRCWSVTSVSNPLPMLGMFGSKQTQEQEVVAYIPNEIWSNPEMKNTLPYHGARYSILKEKSNGSEVLEHLQRMLDIEKTNFFKLIAFDAMSLNSIGLYTSHYSLTDIKSMLETS